MVINRARTGSYSPISDYGIVGDCRSAALVSGAGSIDWWCPDRFDGPSIFAAVLDRRRGGRFRIRPFGLNWSAEQRYVPSTCVLETVFTTLEGRVRLLDFAPMPPEGPSAIDDAHRGLVRVIEGLSGSVTLDVGFDPRFNYGHEVPAIHDLPDGVLAQGRMSQSGRPVGWARLWSSVPMRFEAGRGRIVIAAGDQVALTCRAGTEGASPTPAGQLDHVLDPWVALSDTTAYWSGWASKSTYTGPYHANVERSLLTLKLLTFASTGACVACVTTSLPRWIPSERTCDMRFAWLRDVARAAAAFAQSGYSEEADAAIRWLARTVNEADDHPPTARDVDGDPVSPERELDWLEGYEGCRPIRVGNTAAGSLQLDVAGEIAMAAHGVGGVEADQLIGRVASLAAPRWHEPDLGAWALQAEPRQYVQSRALMATAMRLADAHAMNPNRQFRTIQQEIEAWLEQRGHDSTSGSLTMLSGGIGVDASALRLAASFSSGSNGFQFASTVDAIVARLCTQGFVHPYTPEQDDITGPRGASIPASFWLVHALCALGRNTEAQTMFERLLGYAGSLGLLSEDADPYTARALGNYPSTAAHAALVEAAFALEDR